MRSANEVLPLGVLPHQVVVLFLLVTNGEARTAEVVTVLGGDVTESDTTVNSPLLAATPAVLVTDVAVEIEVFTLITLAALPLEVVVANSKCGTDVPAVETMVALTVTQPVAELYAEVQELLCVCIV